MGAWDSMALLASPLRYIAWKPSPAHTKLYDNVQCGPPSIACVHMRIRLILSVFRVLLASLASISVSLLISGLIIYVPHAHMHPSFASLSSLFW